MESPDFYTDWSYDWKRGPETDLWYFEWTLVDHAASVEYCVLSRCKLICNEYATEIFNHLDESEKQRYIHRAFGIAVNKISAVHFKIRLNDAFEKFEHFLVKSFGVEAWMVEISSRRMGIDTGKDTLVHIDQLLERALAQSRANMKPD